MVGGTENSIRPGCVFIASLESVQWDEHLLPLSTNGLEKPLVNDCREKSFLFSPNPALDKRQGIRKLVKAYAQKVGTRMAITCKIRLPCLWESSSSELVIISTAVGMSSSARASSAHPWRTWYRKPYRESLYSTAHPVDATVPVLQVVMTATVTTDRLRQCFSQGVVP